MGSMFNASFNRVEFLVEIKYVVVASFTRDSKDRNGRWIKNGADPTIVKFRI